MRGRIVPLSRARRFICDLMHFCGSVPTVPVQRVVDLSRLILARDQAGDRIPWTAIFAKALSLVADEFHDFRRAYCKFPWPHLYEYPDSVANIMIERHIDGEATVLPYLIKSPSGRSLFGLGSLIRQASEAPVASIRNFNRVLKLTLWPKPIRRLLWWIGLNIGRQRANYFGTFGISVYSSLGAESLHPLSPLTATLNYGVIDRDGRVTVRLIYDHRVMDGATVARALARLEHILNTTIVDELVRERTRIPELAEY